MEYIIIAWLYVFGGLGILLTQMSTYGDENLLIALRHMDWVSAFGMVAWPITVPLAGVLIAYDWGRSKIKLDNPWL